MKQDRFLKILFLPVAAFVVLAAAAGRAEARWCGWLEATSLGANWTNNYDRLFLSDRDGHWRVRESGGNLPDLSDHAAHGGEIMRDHAVNYLYPDGWSGNFCACMSGRMERRTIVEFWDFELQKMEICHADPHIQRFAPR